MSLTGCVVPRVTGGCGRREFAPGARGVEKRILIVLSQTSQ